MVQIVECSSDSSDSDGRSRNSPEPRSKSSSESAHDGYGNSAAEINDVVGENAETDVTSNKCENGVASGDRDHSSSLFENTVAELFGGDILDILQCSNVAGGEVPRDSDRVQPPEYFVYGFNSNRNDDGAAELAVAPRIATDGVDDETIYPSKKQKKKDKTALVRLQMFLASLIEMVCNGEFEGKNVGVRVALRRLASDFIDSSYLPEDYENFRTVFRRQIAATLHADTKIGVNKSLTVYTPRPNYVSSPSRYGTDFKEIKRIGRGGFGQVFHVHSKIDDCDYAIKKIRFNSATSEPVLKIVSEVRLLASVQHRNVVRYYGAWLEMAPPEAASSTRGSDVVPSENDEDIEEDLSTNQGGNTSSPKHIETNERESSWAKQDDAASENWGCFGEQSATDSNPGISVESSSAPGSKSLTVAKYIAKTDPIHSFLPSTGYAIMFVQMELCSRTLSDYFIERNKAARPVIDRQCNKSVMEQLMSAIAYLHSKNILHRDIKPGNIFLRDDSISAPCVLLGDFGLACLHQTKMPYNAPVGNNEDQEVVTHSCGIGTRIYAAPEQKTSTIYDGAVDVYSAGIVFLELCYPFRTESELARAIMDVREGKINEELKASFPDEADLILQMCMLDPELRPHSFEVVVKLGKIGENTKSLMDRNRELEQEKLRLEQEISRLRDLLFANEISDPGSIFF